MQDVGVRNGKTDVSHSSGMGAPKQWGNNSFRYQPGVALLDISTQFDSKENAPKITQRRRAGQTRGRQDSARCEKHNPRPQFVCPATVTGDCD